MADSVGNKTVVVLNTNEMSVAELEMRTLLFGVAAIARYKGIDFKNPAIEKKDQSFYITFSGEKNPEVCAHVQGDGRFAFYDATTGSYEPRYISFGASQTFNGVVAAIERSNLLEKIN